MNGMSETAVETAPAPSIIETEVGKENRSVPPEVLEPKTVESPPREAPSPEPTEEKQSQTEEAAPHGIERPGAERPFEEEEVELLAFYLAGEEYAVDIMMIQEITRFMEVTAVPRAPSYIRGVVTLRGAVIPVFDMHRRLHLAPFQKGSKSRFIISSLTEGTVAMMVDEITDVVRIKKSRLEGPPSGIASDDARFIDKIGRLGNRLFILLNINEVLKIER